MQDMLVMLEKRKGGPWAKSLEESGNKVVDTDKLKIAFLGMECP